MFLKHWPRPARNVPATARRLKRRWPRPEVRPLERRDVPSASIWTDQADYAFGATAAISGSGFAAGESVRLQVVHAPGTDGSNDDPQNQAWTVTADAAGDVSSFWVVDDPDAPGSTYQLLAAGLTSGETAQATFTDATPVTSNAAVNPVVTNAPPTVTAKVQETGPGAVNIVAAEYFIDVIGANGSGFAVAATDGAFNSKNEDVTATVSAATFNALGQGTHAVWVHGKDANGVWGATVQVSANLLKDTIP